MAKIKVRYVGGAQAEIMGTPYVFRSYGQLVEMPEELVREKQDRISLLTDEEFKSLGHPAQELVDFGRFDSHANAPQEFLDRRLKAWQKVHVNREAAEKAAMEKAAVSEIKAPAETPGKE